MSLFVDVFSFWYVCVVCCGGVVFRVVCCNCCMLCVLCVSALLVFVVGAPLLRVVLLVGDVGVV